MPAAGVRINALRRLRKTSPRRHHICGAARYCAFILPARLRSAGAPHACRGLRAWDQDGCSGRSGGAAASWATRQPNADGVAAKLSRWRVTGIENVKTVYGGMAAAARGGISGAAAMKKRRRRHRRQTR